MTGLHVKPGGFLKLDPSNSIARRARVVMTPGPDGGQINYVDSELATINGAVDRGYSRVGEAQDFDGTTDFLSFPNNARHVPEEVGIFVVATWNGVFNNVFRPLVEKDFTSAAEPFYTYRCIHSRNVGDPKIQAQWNQGGTRRFFTNSTVSFTPTADVPFSFFLSIKDGDQQLWGGDLGNAVFQESSTHAGTIVNYNTELRVGSSQFVAGKHAGLEHLVVIVEGGFTPCEIRSLDKDPFQVFLRPELPVYFSNADAAVTAALTGTITATVDEDDITAGGKTIILTLTGDTFVTGASSEDGIAGGSDSDKTGANKWDALIKTALDNTDVVLSGGDTIATITLPAFGTYDTDEQEIITWTIPAASLTTSSSAIIATPTFTIDEVLAGRIMGSIAGQGGLAGMGGIAGAGGGLAG